MPSTVEEPGAPKPPNRKQMRQRLPVRSVARSSSLDRAHPARSGSSAFICAYERAGCAQSNEYDPARAFVAGRGVAPIGLGTLLLRRWAAGRACPCSVDIKPAGRLTETRA